MKNYVQNRGICSMKESDIGKNPDLDTIQMSVIEQHNSSAAAAEQVEFVKFDKVEYVLCCGMLYFLWIRVKDIVSEEESTIEKMVWKGTSMEVLETNEIASSSTTTKKLSVGKFENAFASLVLIISAPDTQPLRLVRFHNFEENIERRLDIPTVGGWFKFKVYTLTVEAKPIEGKGAKVIIQASVLRREWLKILDEDKASAFRAWQIDMSKAHNPPRVRHRVGAIAKYYPIDLRSPQFVTQTWLALEDHNYKEGKNLEFVKVIKAEYCPAGGEYYYLTFQAKDHGIVTTFQVVVFDKISLKGWKPVTLLKPCKMEDEYDEPEPWTKPWTTYKPQKRVRSRK
ncbi:hypothetical protein ACHQM5_026252 [Ranunculus cassubicifolius]